MKKVNYLYATIIGVLMVMLIVNPLRYIDAVGAGIYMYAIAVLPSLFPFFFFSKLLVGLGIFNRPTPFMDKCFYKLFRLDGKSSYIFIMSLVSGYPIGSKLISDSYLSGDISDYEAEVLSTFCSTSGPLFIIGTVGSAMMLHTSWGYIMLISHYIASIFNGIIWSRLLLRKYSHIKRKVYTKNATVNKQGYLLLDSMQNAVQSILLVGGYIAIFAMVIVAMEDIGIMYIIGELLRPLYELLGISSELIHASSMSLIEVTTGARAMPLSAPSRNIICLTTFFITLGGLSIAMQSLTYLSLCNIKARNHLLQKITQAVISFCIAYIICIMVGI